MVNRPRAPKAWYELQELEARWGQADDWVDAETTAVYRYRTFAFNRAQFISNLNTRSSVHVVICERHQERLDELDKCREEWYNAYHAAKKLIDQNALAKYTEKILPIVREEMIEESK